MSDPSVHLLVSNGLCRRLVAIICAMRWCRDIQRPLIIYWRLPVARTGLNYDSPKILTSENLNLFFQIPPNITLTTLEPDTLEKLTSATAIPTSSSAKIILDEQRFDPEFMPKNLWGNPIYPDDWERDRSMALMVPTKIQNPELSQSDLIINYVHRPFGYGTDVAGILRDFTEDPNIIWKKTEFELQLHQFAHKLRPIPTLVNLIEYQRKILFKPNTTNPNPNDPNNNTIEMKSHLNPNVNRRPRVGFHFRRTDLRPNTSLAQLERILKQQYLPKFKHWDIFICTDDYQFQTYLLKQYPQLKAYEEPAKVQNDLGGAQRALVDLYLLADCDHIIGTRNSAFSYYAWILSGPETLLEYHS